MLRKLLAAGALVGLIAVAAPQAAEASDNAGVVVFTGSAKVGDLAWNNTGTGAGLCFPGLEVNSSTGQCEFTGALSVDDQSWTFKVPDPDATIPPSCNAAGVFDGIPVIPNTDGTDNCSLDTHGTVYANLAGIGPSCGMSRGDSAGGPTGVDDTATITGLDTAGVTVNWLTSAGGSIPISGTVEYDRDSDPAHVHPFDGFVQARPVAGGNCAQLPAEDFVVAGVIATR